MFFTHNLAIGHESILVRNLSLIKSFIPLSSLPNNVLVCAVVLINQFEVHLEVAT